MKQLSARAFYLTTLSLLSSKNIIETDEKFAGVRCDVKLREW